MKWSKYQKAIFKNVAEGEGNLVVNARAGSGKCLGKGTLVLMYDGSTKKVENIKPSDFLMGPDSKPRKVLSTAKGHGPLYKVVPTKGKSWICNDSHILSLAGSNRERGKIKDISVKELLKEYEAFTAQGYKARLDKNWKLWRAPVEFTHSDLEIDPYLLGLWIGDGATSKPTIWSMDPEIISYCKDIASKYGLETVISKTASKAYRIRFRVGVRGKAGRNTLHRFLQKECIVNKVKNIPQKYLVNSEDNRLQLLAGILDTDGYYYRGYFEVTSVLESLADQYCFLARSLGFAAYKRKKKTSIKSLNYEGIAYRVTISGDVDRIPTKLKRKKAKPRKQIKRVNVTGFDLKSIGDGEYFGFMLDGDGRFLLGDFTVTHNTSTLIEALNYIPPFDDWLLCAFNKRIANELKRRAPENSNGQCKTLHSLGLRAVKERWPFIDIEVKKVWDILDDLVGKDKKFNDIKFQIKKAITLCKGRLVNDYDDIDLLLDDYNIDIIDYDRDEFIRLISKTLLACYEDTDTVDFDDMIWFPNMYDLNAGSYQRIFIDECQDLNKAQIELALSCCNDDGRITLLGDDKQAIYQFTGVNINSFDDLTKRLDAETLPLPITYRCPVKITKHAQQYAPDIQHAPGAPEGVLEYITSKEMRERAKPGCFILSRVNAPLIGLALGFIRQGTPCNIQGRDIGANLISLIKKSRRKTTKSFIKWLDAWEEKEIKRLRTKGRSTVTVVDKAECLRALADDCTKVSEMKGKINNLFEDEDDTSRIMLSSVHKSKGLERDVVFVLSGTFFGSDQSERNIKYVAATRSAAELLFVTGGNYSRFKR